MLAVLAKTTGTGKDTAKEVMTRQDKPGYFCAEWRYAGNDDSATQVMNRIGGKQHEKDVFFDTGADTDPDDHTDAGWT